jgi:ComF family protein
MIAAPPIHCRCCGRPGPPDGGAEWRCPECSNHRGPDLDLAWAWGYQPPIDRVIRAFKLGGLEPLGTELGQALWWAAGWSASRRLPAVDWVVPVPTTWWSEAHRGFNPAEEIARPIAAALGAPLLRLRRNVWRRSQRSLDRRHRLVNLRGAFRLSVPRNLDGARLLVVDDVVTTGATLETLNRMLYAAGAARIVSLVACRTPAPGEVRGVSDRR